MAQSSPSTEMGANKSSDTEMGVEVSSGFVSNPNNFGSHFSIEGASSVNREDEDVDNPLSAHRIGHDPWYQLGVLLAVSFNCGYILGFSNLIMKPLGWAWGPMLMAVLAILSVYANRLLANFHIIDGRRFIRYRDLMGFAFGRKMYYVTWVLQFLNFILGNMGFLLLSGRALKEIYLEYNKSSTMTLQEFIIISGAVYFIFAFLVPHLSAMRIWCAVSTFLTLIYVVILMKFSISNGISNSQNYKLQGTTSKKIFNGLSAIAAIMFTNNSGMVPELQASLRKPAIKNMHKALYFQFSVGLSVYYTVTIIGYWAYGSLVSEYLLSNLSAPKWAKILANVAVYLQIIISQNMFCAPIHETVDTRFSRLDEKEFSPYNMLMRLILRFIFFTINTFVACMLPFLGDFVNLVGSISLIPLTFVFPSLIFLKVKGQKINILENTWHWLNVVAFSLLTGATTISSFHSIVDNAKTYHLFANM